MQITREKIFTDETDRPRAVLVVSNLDGNYGSGQVAEGKRVRQEKNAELFVVFHERSAKHRPYHGKNFEDMTGRSGRKYSPEWFQSRILRRVPEAPVHTPMHLRRGVLQYRFKDVRVRILHQENPVEYR